MATAASLSLKPPARFLCGGERRKRTAAGFSVARASQGNTFHESMVRLSASTVLILGLSLRVCSPASARIPPPVISIHSVSQNETDSHTVVVEEEERRLEAEFEAYKAKVYSLTLPLKLVALRGSVPPSWIKEFISSQGKRVRLKTRFLANLEDIVFDLSKKKPTNKGKSGSADMISLGDSWLSFAIKEKLIEPMKGVEDQDWYKGLSDKWKVYLRRNYAGEQAPEGETVAKLMSEYTVGKMPKAFVHITKMERWQDVLYLTEPEKWSPNAMCQATRIFAHHLKNSQIQRFYNYVLLPRVREDIRKNKRLHFALYQAVKKSLYKPSAFNKGILFPLCKSGTCSLREAVILGSILEKCSFPVDHSGIALLNLAEMEYCGTTRYKYELLKEDKEHLQTLIKRQNHHLVTPEIVKELQVTTINNPIKEDRFDIPEVPMEED
ncbi:hypothetical protein F2Q69_00053716 [Brassica cretica]|uniref:Uncharacterized protein n=3 Tax=Brassica cretica TaxID=69181 RepID=A0A8S9MPS1_BRACR|nr:hypothetical protein F2Q69_00053716 [Brassica cretica]